MIDVKSMPQGEADRLAAATSAFFQRVIGDDARRSRICEKMSDAGKRELEAYIEAREKKDRETAAYLKERAYLREVLG